LTGGFFVQGSREDKLNLHRNALVIDGHHATFWMVVAGKEFTI
jgi:hypothetical protein